MNEKQQTKNKKSAKLDSNSKTWRTFLVVSAAFLTFAGPTYVVYVLLNIFEIGYAASMLSGLVLLLAGLMLIWYLTKKKIAS
ncbi:MAG: hypothetical protein ACUVUF_04655 [Candidatus Bathycorpusculaceae bacterium]